MTRNAGELTVNIDRKAYAKGSGDGNRLAIEDLSFTAAAGEFVCIVGPSGCGKTTMLNIIASLDVDADSDVVFADGSSVDEARVSYMFQTPRLLPWASVRDNVRIVLSPADAADDRAERLLERMELGDSLDEYPNRLSGGMQRRVALARAFVTEPDLMLLDEPFVSLDVPVGNRLRGILLDLWQASPTTVLFVTHDLREAIYLADRILFLSRGPSRVILDVPVPLVRPRKPESQEIESFRQELLTKHASLLHGLTDQDNDDADHADQTSTSAADRDEDAAAGHKRAGEVA
jgi:NitT/TauT family transport system ATP-binding protein